MAIRARWLLLWFYVLCLWEERQKMAKIHKTCTLTSNNSLIFPTGWQQKKYLHLFSPHKHTYLPQSIYFQLFKLLCEEKKTTTLKKQQAQTVQIKHHFISLSKKRGWFTLQLLKVLKNPLDCKPEVPVRYLVLITLVQQLESQATVDSMAGWHSSFSSLPETSLKSTVELVAFLSLWRSERATFHQTAQAKKYSMSQITQKAQCSQSQSSCHSVNLHGWDGSPSGLWR